MRPSVLIVEDSDDTRELVGEYLMLEGYHSIMARSGVDALNRLKEIQPDLIITDLHMPEMDGIALITELRKIEALTRTPVILMSAVRGEQADAALRSASLTVDRILTKPVAVGQLVAAIEALLAGRPAVAKP